MPKGKVPSLLSTNNGGITFDLSKKKSNCSRCHCHIEADSKIGQMKVQRAGFTNLKRICLACTLEIVLKTQKELDAIRLALG